MADESSILRIGHPTEFTLTHARCDLRFNGRRHRFEVTFERSDFRATALIDAEIDAFISFREALRVVYRDLQGTAVLETLERDLKLEATVDKLGHVSWNGAVGFGHSGRGGSAEYRFWIGDDQSSLPTVLGQLDAIIDVARAEKA